MKLFQSFLNSSDICTEFPVIFLRFLQKFSKIHLPKIILRFLQNLKFFHGFSTVFLQKYSEVFCTRFLQNLPRGKSCISFHFPQVLSKISIKKFQKLSAKYFLYFFWVFQDSFIIFPVSLKFQENYSEIFP